MMSLVSILLKLPQHQSRQMKQKLISRELRVSSKEGKTMLSWKILRFSANWVKVLLVRFSWPPCQTQIRTMPSRPLGKMCSLNMIKSLAQHWRKTSSLRLIINSFVEWTISSSQSQDYTLSCHLSMEESCTKSSKNKKDSQSHK